MSNFQSMKVRTFKKQFSKIVNFRPMSAMHIIRPAKLYEGQTIRQADFSVDS